MNTHVDHAALEAHLRALTARTLSPAARYTHVAVLLLALIMCALIGSLLATEPALPGRAQAAFGVMLLIGASWVGYAAWVLGNRKTLLANQQVVAGCMAVGFTGTFFACSAVAVLISGSTLALAAAATGGTLLACALAVLVSATSNAARLRALQRMLEGQLSVG
jgi:membrane associated rhomboid family serine protease